MAKLDPLFNYLVDQITRASPKYNKNALINLIYKKKGMSVPKHAMNY